MLTFLKKIFKDKDKVLTEDEIVADLVKNEYSHTILNNKKEELGMLHHSLGRSIRNDYKLWTKEWEPEIRDGVDWSPNHPDAISTRIIHKLYDYWNSHPKELTKRLSKVS